jgi:hypothetical protein
MVVYGFLMALITSCKTVLTALLSNACLIM